MLSLGRIEYLIIKLGTWAPDANSLQPQALRKPERLVWAISFSLATTKEIINLFLFLRLLRCFTSAGSLRTRAQLGSG